MPPLPAQADFPAIEHEMLARWNRQRTFDASLKQTEGADRWTFYEGPPTANGMPGVHHIEARVFKDVFPRFKTMQGFHVTRKGGWDCHGLPVEVAVEKELGLSGKKDIEAYGVAEFNERCRESVLRHVDAFAALTTRMGYWIDLSTAYRTMDADYVESVWWALKSIYDKGLLVRDFRISPYCPRCGTPLSDHEMGQPDVYKDVADPSVTVRFPITKLPAGANPQLAGADLLVWTTTPWTLVSNTAVAVHPEVEYVVARRSGGLQGTVPAGKERGDEDKVVVANALWPRVLGEGWHVVATVRGAELLGASYQRPFDLVDIPDAHRVVAGTFVTTEDGTGLVHLAPAFGADDLAAIRANGMTVVNPVRADGRFEEDLPMVGGLFFKDADSPLIADLAERGLLFKSELHTHSYPHCWRCNTVLLYYALPSWYIRTTAIKDELLAQNEQTNWQPATIKHGRYGEWLRNNVDWALSRTRYWGTPLPIWSCPSDHVTCVGSLAELGGLAGEDLSGLDPHRPYVDDVAFPCPECGLPATRAPEVIDVWFDSGSMPFAQWGAPLRNVASFEEAYPAQFICEAIDQTRGWFYSLMAVGTLVFGRSPYENVVCLGLVMDESGRKMSKHLGNVIEPMGLMNLHGADAVRWFFAASGSPWAPRRIGPHVLDEIVRKVLLTYWNTASFLVLYANAAGADGAGGAGGSAWTPEASRLGAAGGGPAAARPVAAVGGARVPARCDGVARGIRHRHGRTAAGGPDRRSVQLVRAPLAAAVLGRAGVGRRRLGVRDPARGADGGHRDDGADHAVPGRLPVGRAAAGRRARVGAPGVVADVGPGPDRPGAVDPDGARPAAGRARPVGPVGGLGADQAAARRALVGAAGFAALPAELRDLIAEELNVHEVEPLDAVGRELVTYTVKPEFRALGKRFGSSTQAVAGAIRAADPAVLAHAVSADGGSAVVQAAGLGSVTLTADDLVVTQTPLEGWGVATAAGETVALDLAVSDALRAEGWAREVVRLIQDARKGDGLQVSDRIELRWATPDEELAAALTAHGELIAGEVLAVSFGPGAGSGDGPGPWYEHADDDLGLRFRLAVSG